MSLQRKYFIYTRKTKNQVSTFFRNKKECAKQRKQLNSGNNQYAVGSVVIRRGSGVVQLKPLDANINITG